MPLLLPPGYATATKGRKRKYTHFTPEKRASSHSKNSILIIGTFFSCIRIIKLKQKFLVFLPQNISGFRQSGTIMNVTIYNHSSCVATVYCVLEASSWFGVIFPPATQVCSLFLMPLYKHSTLLTHN